MELIGLYQSIPIYFCYAETIEMMKESVCIYDDQELNKNKNGELMVTITIKYLFPFVSNLLTCNKAKDLVT